MGKESATREGASVLGEDNPGVRRVGQDRLAAMDALANQRREIVSEESGVKIEASPAAKDPDAEELDETIVDPDDPEGIKAEKAKAEAAKADEEREAQLKAQSGADDRVVLEGDLSRYVIKGKVDGEEREIPLARAVALLQKDAAADKRLEDATREATRIKKEAEAALAAAKEEGSKAAIRQAEKVDADATKNLEELRNTIKAATDALFAGDVDAATDLFVKVNAGRREATSPDVNEIANVVLTKVGQRTALTQFHKDYPEIGQNEYLSRMCDARVTELMTEGNTFEEALPKAGSHVRDSIRKLAGDIGMTDGGKRQPAQVDRSSKKAGIDEPITARSAQASTTQEKGASAPSDVIAEMRAQRMPGVKGQPPA